MLSQHEAIDLNVCWHLRERFYDTVINGLSRDEVPRVPHLAGAQGNHMSCGRNAIRRRLITVYLIVTVVLAKTYSADAVPPYRNPKLPVPARVADLVSRMTLDEKQAQLQSAYAGELRLRDGILGDPGRMSALFKQGLGMINPDFEADLEQTVDWRNEVQAYLRTRTRLGIPTVFVDEAHHGLLLSNADVFPHGIALASTWDPKLLERIYGYIADQARARGTTLVLSPVIDVTRDPRWGRTGETFGEDPYLNGILGGAVVRGLQGSADGSIASHHVAATLKHFAGHGQPEGGINQGPANFSTRVLREVHMEPFRLAIQSANPAAIMACYCEIDGIPAHANPWLLEDVLRTEWHYEGLVVSDWWGIDQLWRTHAVEPDERRAALRAFNSGVTVDLPSGRNFSHLAEWVREGSIREARLDAQVARVLTLKFKLGLFEEGPIDLLVARSHAAREAGRQLARRAAEEAIVLLKNDHNLLPLRLDRYRRIAVVGPGAATNLLGDYSAVPEKNVSLLDGIRARVGSRAEVAYSPGCRLSRPSDAVRHSNYQNAGRLELPSPEDNRLLIEAAAKVASASDLVIVAVGENEQFSQEAGSTAPGDMSDLNLQANQDDLVKAMIATGKPVVVYLMHARPLAIDWIAANAPAIVDGWFAGEEAGNAAAAMIFGDVNPSGKLTITVPRSVGQLPVYYNHKPSARGFDYVTEKERPLFPFGYGLSYATFRYSNLRLLGKSMAAQGSAVVAVDVANTSGVAGDEIVELYIHQKVSSATRPIKELKDFVRIYLRAGEQRTVRFTLDASKLSFWTAAMRYTIEPGEFEIMVGRTSEDVLRTTLTVTP
jgi:beta-glucosidase